MTELAESRKFVPAEYPSTGYARDLQRFYADLRNESGPHQRTIVTNGREEFMSVLDPAKVFAPTRAVVVEMHDDDKGIAGGTLVKLAKTGIGITNITVTTGGGRPRDNLSVDEVEQMRREEGVASASIIGAGAYINLGYEDMRIKSHIEPITTTLTQYLRMVDPHIVITLNPNDHNLDHKYGAEIVYDALYRARNAIDAASYPDIPITEAIPALYYMDPQSLVDSSDRTIKPGLLVRIFPNEAEKQIESLLEYHSQYEDRKDLWEFPERGHQRGRLVRWRHAEGLTQDLSGGFSSNDTITSILGRRNAMHTSGIRYGARRMLGATAKTHAVRER